MTKTYFKISYWGFEIPTLKVILPYKRFLVHIINCAQFFLVTFQIQGGIHTDNKQKFTISEIYVLPARNRGVFIYNYKIRLQDRGSQGF